MEGRGSGRFSIAILLGVAYSSSVGGVATLVGTPPNLSFARIFHIYFPELPEVSFYKWLIFALPLALSIAAFIWIYLYFVFRPAKGEWREVERDIFHIKLKEMGSTTREQKIVFVIFSFNSLYVNFCDTDVIVNPCINENSALIIYNIKSVSIIPAILE